VAVYQAPLDGTLAQRSMPEGCRLVVTGPPVPMSEVDLMGQKDPFRVERADAARSGANALLVLSSMMMSRRDSECPTASPITDCPGTLGAWYRVQVETYQCTPDALGQLPAFPKGR